MSFKLPNLLALIALAVLILILIVGGCPFAWMIFGWFAGAAMTAWGLAKLMSAAGRLVA